MSMYFTVGGTQLGTVSIAPFYIARKEGSNTVVRDLSGVVLVSDSSPRNAFTSAFTAISAVKGTIYIVDGDYEISERILANYQDLSIDGGKNARLYLASGHPTTYTYHTILDIDHDDNVNVRNILLDGNYTNNSSTVTGGGYVGLIKTLGCKHVNIDGIGCVNARQFGIWVQVLSGDISYDVNIKNCIFKENKWNAVSYVLSEAAGKLYDCECAHNYVEGSCDIGLDTFGEETATNMERIVFRDNVVDGYTDQAGFGSGNPPALYGIRFEGGYHHVAEGNTIRRVARGVADSSVAGGSGKHKVHNNDIYTNGSGAWASIVMSQDKNIITENRCHLGFASIGIDGIGSRSTIKNNYIYNESGTGGAYAIAMGYSGGFSVVEGNVFQDIFAYYLTDVHISNILFLNNMCVVSGLAVSAP